MDETTLIHKLFDTRYRVADSARVRHTLTGLLEQRQILSAYLRQNTPRATSLLSFEQDPDSALILDEFAGGDVPDPKPNQTIRLLGRHRGIYVGAILRFESSRLWHGYPAYVCAFDGSLQILQQRQWHRVSIPPKSRIQCTLRKGDVKEIGGMLYDVSVGGVSVTTSPDYGNQRQGVDVGEFYDHVEFSLHRNHEIDARGRVANVRRVPGDHQGRVFIGIEFVEMSQEDQRVLSRYIQEREREILRRERGY